MAGVFSGVATLHLAKMNPDEAAPRPAARWNSNQPPSADDVIAAVPAGNLDSHPSRQNISRQEMNVLIGNVQRKAGFTKSGRGGEWSMSASNILLETLLRPKLMRRGSPLKGARALADGKAPESSNMHIDGKKGPKTKKRSKKSQEKNKQDDQIDIDDNKGNNGAPDTEKNPSESSNMHIDGEKGPETKNKSKK